MIIAAFITAIDIFVWLLVVNSCTLLRFLVISPTSCPIGEPVTAIGTIRNSQFITVAVYKEITWLANKTFFTSIDYVAVAWLTLEAKCLCIIRKGVHVNLITLVFIITARAFISYLFIINCTMLNKGANIHLKGQCSIICRTVIWETGKAGVCAWQSAAIGYNVPINKAIVFFL